MAHVDGLAVDDGFDDLGVEELLRIGLGDVAVEDDEVCEVAFGEDPFLVFRELCVGRGLCVGVESLIESDFFLRLKGLSASFIHARGGGVEAAEGADGFDGVVGAEGEGDVVVEHGAPGVSVFAALGA